MKTSSVSKKYNIDASVTANDEVIASLDAMVDEGSFEIDFDLITPFYKLSSLSVKAGLILVKLPKVSIIIKMPHPE